HPRVALCTVLCPSIHVRAGSAMTNVRRELEALIPDELLIDGYRVDLQPLVDIVATLRSAPGCPWDRKQTHTTLRKYVLEEAYAVAEAIDVGAPEALAHELGDLLLVIALHAQSGAESGTFDLNDSIGHICRKMVRRHPHVFGDERHLPAEEVPRRWGELKAEEGRTLLEGVPRSLPALARAQAIAQRAATAGFDWDRAVDVLPKIAEECDEVRDVLERTPDDADRLESEVGDLLFAAMNLARKLNVDAEAALHRATRKFEARFGHVERRLGETGRYVADT